MVAIARESLESWLPPQFNQQREAEADHAKI
jgi:hypothetical protein